MPEPQTETLYSASYVSEQLGVSPAQTRRWAAAYETVTGHPIKMHARTGRAYSQGQLETLLEAKQIAQSASGMSAEMALSIALGKTGLSVPLKTFGQAPELNTAALSRAMADALTEAQRPLLAELQAMRAQLELLQPQGHQQALPEPQGGQVVGQGQRTEPGPPSEGERRSGVLVRAAERIEFWLQRVVGR